jgi:hypothetical protein
MTAIVQLRRRLLICQAEAGPQSTYHGRIRFAMRQDQGCRRRVVVGHSISAIKHCAILKDDLQMRANHIHDTVMEIACGFHNLRIQYRP